MPIYEFTCRQCGRRFECLVRMGGEKETVCPGCGSADILKAVSCFGIGGGSSRLKEASSSCSTCSTKSCSTCH